MFLNKFFEKKISGGGGRGGGGFTCKGPESKRLELFAKKEKRERVCCR